MLQNGTSGTPRPTNRLYTYNKRDTICRVRVLDEPFFLYPLNRPF